MRLWLGRIDHLIFDVFFLWTLAAGAFFFGHLGWGVLFGSTAFVESAIKTRRYLRRRRGSDWYER